MTAVFFLIIFLEGIVSFLSPCILPMIPIYLSYMAGDDAQNTKAKTIQNALMFVFGFGLVFSIMGAAAGTLGALMAEYQRYLELAGGVVVLVIGLQYMQVLRIKPFFRGFAIKAPVITSFATSFLFGVIFAIGWTPCVGAFLSSALFIASTQNTVVGILLLLTYSLGLGIPFILSAILVDQLKTSITFITKHRKIINLLSGGILIITGLAMMTGQLSKWLAIISGINPL